jgi:hypothetical protein
MHFKILKLLLLATSALAQHPLKGDVLAVIELLDRVLPSGGTKHFVLKVGDYVSVEAPCFRLEDNRDDRRLLVMAASAPELSVGLGWYLLRQFCNMTIGWPRGGGSNLFLPKPDWPSIGKMPICKRRIVPWNYLMNVCTHSYSLVWYD